jgi:hemerythrin superfamily protein
MGEWRNDQMNALEVLKQDHQKVKALFQEATHAADISKRRDLFDKIDTELEMHAHIEEAIFYPAIEDHEGLKDMVAEALEEHEQAKTLLGELEELGADNHEFGSKLQQLMETVEHHIEEEEGEMFPKIREIFEDELEQLGSAIGQRHAESASRLKKMTPR